LSFGPKFKLRLDYHLASLFA